MHLYRAGMSPLSIPVPNPKKLRASSPLKCLLPEFRAAYFQHFTWLRFLSSKIFTKVSFLAQMYNANKTRGICTATEAMKDYPCKHTRCSFQAWEIGTLEAPITSCIVLNSRVESQTWHRRTWWLKLSTWHCTMPKVPAASARRQKWGGRVAGVRRRRKRPRGAV